MWIKYADKHPDKDGEYIIAVVGHDGKIYHAINNYVKDLEKTGWHCDEGNEGFFDQDPFDGSLYMVTLIAWAEFEEYKG